MPVMRDYECVCGEQGEIIFDSPPDFIEFTHKKCGKPARLVWKSFGPKNRIGGEKGRFPYFDLQAGETFHSAKDRQHWMKKEGRFINRRGSTFEMMGKDEFTRSAAAEPDRSDDVPWDSDKFRDAAMRAYNDIKYGNVEVPRMRTMDEVMVDAPTVVEAETAKPLDVTSSTD